MFCCALVGLTFSSQCKKSLVELAVPIKLVSFGQVGFFTRQLKRHPTLVSNSFIIRMLLKFVKL